MIGVALGLYDSSMDQHLGPSRDPSLRLGIGRDDGDLWMPWVDDADRQSDLRLLIGKLHQTRLRNPMPRVMS